MLPYQHCGYSQGWGVPVRPPHRVLLPTCAGRFFTGRVQQKHNGRPSVDPVMLFKIVLIQHLYGIPSLQRTMKEIEMNIAYRYMLNEQLPHFSTVSYNFRHRFTEQTAEQVFSWILEEANRAG